MVKASRLKIGLIMSVLVVAVITVCMRTHLASRRNAAVNYHRAYVLLSRGREDEAISEIKKGVKKDIYEPRGGDVMGLSEDESSRRITRESIAPKPSGRTLNEHFQSSRATRTLAKRLIQEGELHERNQEFSQAIEDYQTVVRFGEHIGTGDYAILTQLRGMSVQSMGYERLQVVYGNTEAFSEMERVGKELDQMGARKQRFREQIVQAEEQDREMVREQIDRLTRGQQKRIRCQGMLAAISMGMLAYTLDSDGWLPPHLSSLTDRLTGEDPRFHGLLRRLEAPRPVSRLEQGASEADLDICRYAYVPGYHNDDAPTSIIVMDASVDNHGGKGVYVLPLHGRVQWLATGFSENETPFAVRRRTRLLYIFVAVLVGAVVSIISAWCWVRRKSRLGTVRARRRGGNSA